MITDCTIIIISNFLIVDDTVAVLVLGSWFAGIRSYLHFLSTNYLNHDYHRLHCCIIPATSTRWHCNFLLPMSGLIGCSTVVYHLHLHRSLCCNCHGNIWACSRCPLLSSLVSCLQLYSQLSMKPRSAFYLDMCGRSGPLLPMCNNTGRCFLHQRLLSVSCPTFFKSLVLVTLWRSAWYPFERPASSHIWAIVSADFPFSNAQLLMCVSSS
jgi:hypothetical protein